MSVQVYSLFPSSLSLNLLSKEAFARLGKREDDTLLGSVKALAALEQLLHSSLPLLFPSTYFWLNHFLLLFCCQESKWLGFRTCKFHQSTESHRRGCLPVGRTKPLKLMCSPKQQHYLNCSLFLFQNTPQDSELGQPPGNGHNLKRSPQKNSTEKSGGQDISDPLGAAVPLAESLSPSSPGPTR